MHKVLLLAALLLVSAAKADDIKLPPAFRAVLEAQADCGEITDQCVVCKKADGAWACSMPGIACVAEAPKCAVPKP